MLYFGQVYVFCWLINKSALERFLLIICKYHTLRRYTNLFSRNHPILCFWLKAKDWQIMPITEQLLYQTDKSSYWGCSIKNAVRIRKNLQYSHKTIVLKSLLINFKFIKKGLQHRCFPVNIAKFLRKPILKNICVRLLSKPSWIRNIINIPAAFKPEL